MLVSFGIEASLVLFSLYLVVGPLLDRVQLLVLLQLVKCLALLLNHIAVREREVVNAVHGLELLFVVTALLLLVLENLISLDKCVSLVDFVLLLKVSLILHLLALETKQVLLIFALFELLVHFSVFFLVDLIDYLAQEVVVVRAIKDDALRESVAHASVDETGQEWVRQRLLKTVRRRGHRLSRSRGDIVLRESVWSRRQVWDRSRRISVNFHVQVGSVRVQGHFLLLLAFRVG